MKRTLRHTIFPLLALLCSTHIQGQSLSRSEQFGFAHPQRAIPTDRNALPMQLRVSDHREYPQMMESFDWIDSTSFWDPFGQSTYTYSINGWLLQEVKSLYQNGSLDLNNRMTYTYNLDGQLTEELTEYHIAGAWVNSYRYNASYIGAYPSIQAYYYWNGSAWDTSYCYLQRTTLNGNNDPVSFSYAEWNLSTKVWDSTYKSVLTYLSSPAWNSWTNYDWVGAWQPSARIVDATWHDFEKDFLLNAKYQTYAGSAWRDSERLSATYGTNDSHVIVYERYNGGNWAPYERGTVRYDQQAHETYYREEAYDSTTQAWTWEYADSANHSYDGNGNTTQIIYAQQDSSQAWTNYWKEVFGNFFVGVAAPVAPQVSVTAYPNPATDALHFALTDVQHGAMHIALYDLQGRLRVSNSLRYSGQEVVLPVSELLESGMYTYTLQTASGTAAGKVVVQR